MADVLNVTIREAVGTRAVRRLREAGQVPAVLYGHGEANVNLSIPTAEIWTVLRHGSHVVSLAGGVSDKALIKDVQWDAFNMHPMHVDLTRVSERERVTVTVGVELRGEAPGAKQGGMVEQLVHELEVEGPAGKIPERLSASINELQLGETVTADSIELPAGVALVTPDNTAVAHCLSMAPTLEEEEEEALEAGAAEPEIIGRKPESEEGAGE